jgi:hypothetical protein
VCVCGCCWVAPLAPSVEPVVVWSTRVPFVQWFWRESRLTVNSSVTTQSHFVNTYIPKMSVADVPTSFTLTDEQYKDLKKTFNKVGGLVCACVCVCVWYRKG